MDARVPSAGRTPRRMASAIGVVGMLLLGAAAYGGSLTAPAPVRAQAPVQETPEANVLRGTLLSGGLGCAPAGAHLQPCDGSPAVAIEAAGLDLAPYIGREVRAEGVWRTCATSAEQYLQLSTIGLMDCGAQTPTPPPPTGPQNLALGATVTASSASPDGAAAHLTDGLADTAWKVPPERSAWAFIDLGRERLFNELVLRWGDAYAREFAVYVWDDLLDDDGDWVRLAYRPDGRGGDERLTIPRTQGRFVLLHLTHSNVANTGFTLREWEVYGQQTPNLALGCVARASPAQEDRPPWRVIDGDTDTDWASVPGDRHPHVVITCDQPIDVFEIRIRWGQRYSNLYSVGFYRNGNLARSFGVAADGGLDRFSWPDSVNADGVLIYSHAMPAAMDFIQVTELELYSLGAGDDEALDDGGDGVARSSRAAAEPHVATGARVLWYNRFGEWDHLAPPGRIGLPIGPGPSTFDAAGAASIDGLGDGVTAGRSSDLRRPQDHDAGAAVPPSVRPPAMRPMDTR